MTVVAATFWAMPVTVRGQMQPVTAQIFVSGIHQLSGIDYTDVIGEYTLSGTEVSTVSDTAILGTLAGALAISGSNLFVMNQNAGTVDQYAISGTAVTLVTASLISGLTHLQSILVSGSMIFVGNNGPDTVGGGTVSAYTTSGALVNASLVAGITNPTGIAVSGTTLFICDEYNGICGEYTTSGAVLNAALLSNLGNPDAMVMSGNNLFITDPSTQSLSKYSVSGTTAARDTSFAPVSCYSTGIALSGSDLFVTDVDTHDVFEITTAGVMVNPSLIGGYWSNGPTGIAVLAPQPVAGVLSSGTLQFTAPVAPGAPLFFTATQSDTGATVTLQYSLDGTTWNDVPDANGGVLSGSGGLYTTGTAGTTFYPAGQVYFRAVSSDTGQQTISNVIGPVTLQQAQLIDFRGINIHSDPIHGVDTHIGDNLTYTFTVINSGSATAKNVRVVTPFPTYIQNITNLTTQFSESDIPPDGTGNKMISSGFSFPITGGTNQIAWDAGDLDAGNQLSETFTIHISNDVRLQQELGLPIITSRIAPRFNHPPPRPALPAAQRMLAPRSKARSV